MSNFNFISQKFNDAFQAAKEAEQLAFIKPIASGMFCRQSMEFLINWVYDIDVEYERPYKNTLGAKIHGDDITRDVEPKIIRELEYIRKVGNNAVHNRKITQREAEVAVKYLFHWSQYVIKTYTEIECPQSFNDEFIPKQDVQKELLREIALQKELLQKQRDVIQDQRTALESNEEAISALQKEQQASAQIKVENKHLPIPDLDISEAETRKLYIDADLKAIGWDLEKENVIEYELTNFPKHINSSGTGYVDYVLWGDNGLPLAVVEAKRTCENVKLGRTQASIYAECLEKKFGQKPIIFYSNGIETWLWDDHFAPPRQVFGFYSKEELQRLVNRRVDRKDLRDYKPNPDIAGRYYQSEAIQRIGEAFCDKSKDRIVQKKRKALVVMATGTGKTRTAIALTDIMMKANWAKKILFLADRNALVTQAKNNFTALLPQHTSINLTKEREDPDTRLVFSTYNTMINRIDATGSGDNVYGVGHFDLIIVDEAHRSIYKKYQDIFHYFDGLIVGLTATPIDEADRDTYEFFDCEPETPTYFYELDQAVNDKFLTPPKQISVPTRFLQRGIKYADLSDEEKEEYDKAFAAYGEEPPKEINASAINKWLFNKPTVIEILNYFMANGIKVDSGESIGKTIIFAISQRHADFIQEVFEEQFPEEQGKVASVITYKDRYAQDSIDKFKEKDRNPRIAISVDMLDTGIDVPEIVNLIFFKPVYSKSKFWQMIGRGTRLCPDLFAPGKDKEDFLIFDCCGNFEFFNINPEGRSGNSFKSLSNRLFEVRVLLAEALRKSDDDNAKDYRTELLDLSHDHVDKLYRQRDQKFSVKMRLAAVRKYKDRDSWNDLNHIRVEEIGKEIGPIIKLDDPDKKAMQFDLMMYQMEMYLEIASPLFDKSKENLKLRAKFLEEKGDLNLVKPKLPLIQRIQQDKFWKGIDVPSLEHIRIQLRDLMNLLQGPEQEIVYTNMTDDVMPGEVANVSMPTTPQNYLDKVKSYIRNNSKNIVIQKLKTNQAVTERELGQLEDLLFDGEERGTKEEFVKAIGDPMPLGAFVRSIIGLDRSSVLEAFSKFLNKGNLSADQQKFVEVIINHFEHSGLVKPKDLYDDPQYKAIHIGGVSGVFKNDNTKEIISIMKEINEKAIA